MIGDCFLEIVLDKLSGGFNWNPIKRTMNLPCVLIKALGIAVDHSSQSNNNLIS